MIKNISINNYAIFDEINLCFENGLTVITGETGAGKSIFLSAIRAALGGEVKGTDVRSGEKKAIIEIEVNQHQQEIICRKIIHPSGRNRSFINDEPMNKKAYKNRLSTIADFHGQHEQQYIMQQRTHIDFLDTYGKLKPQVSKLSEVFNKLITAKTDLRKLIAKQKKAKDRKELLSFQLQEIDSIRPEKNEDVILYRQFKMLKHIDRLISTSTELNHRLTEQDQSIYNELSDILRELEELVSVDEKVQPYAASMEESLNALMDASQGLRQYAESIDHDENKLEKVELRLLEIEGLNRKYGGSLEAVLEYRDSIEKELNSFQNLNKEISELENNIETIKDDYTSVAVEIHKARKRSIPELSKQIVNELADLNIAGATFKVKIEVKSRDESDIQFENQPVEYLEKGIDYIEFHLSANPGEDVKPLIDVASGGEVSRIMLAIKTIFQKVGSGGYIGI